MNSRASFRTKKYFFAAVIVASLVAFSFVVYAASPPPPTGGYSPGDSLDPGCAPGTTDCIVKTGWGSIQGTLSDQTDLQTALNGKISTTGTANEVLYYGDSGTATGDPFFIHSDSSNDTFIGRPLTGTTPGLGGNKDMIENADNGDLNIGGSFNYQQDTSVLAGGILDISGVGNNNPFSPFSITSDQAFSEVTNGSGSNFAVSIQAYDQELGFDNFFQSKNNKTVIVYSGGPFSTDEQVTGSSSGATGYITTVPPLAPTNTIDVGGVVDGLGGGFQNGETITGATSHATATIVSANVVTVFGTFDLDNDVDYFAHQDETGTIKSFDIGQGFIGYKFDNSDQVNFPLTLGTAGQVLTTDGAGNWSWSSVSGPIDIENGTSLFSNGLYTISSNAQNSNFLGYQAGDGTVGGISDGSNFFGYQAGQNASNADDSNFLGNAAGNGATNANRSNFLGIGAGANATNADDSNFFGNSTGSGATNANNSNFFGAGAGANATNADDSTFIGVNAGENSTNAKESIFIGDGAGTNDSVKNVSSGGSSILIGNGTSTGTGGHSNSIALGTDATNTVSNQFVIGSSTSPINTTVIYGSGGTTCTITTGTNMSCSSDERLKTNISDLSTDELDTLDKVRTVTFNWDYDPSGSQNIGFLAQDIQQYYPQLVSTAPNGYLQVNYAGITPVLVESIRELNLKLTDIQNFATATDTTFLTTLENWLASATNGIANIFSKTVTTNQLCIADASGQTCLDRSQVDQILQSSNVTVTTTNPPASSTVTSDTATDPSPTLPQGEGAATQTPAVVVPIITPPTTDSSSSTVTSDTSDATSADSTSTADVSDDSSTPTSPPAASMVTSQ